MRASRPQTAVCRLLGARASCPRSPHEGGTPAWGCGRLVRRQQCDPSRARGHRALGRLTRAGRPPGSAGVSPADSSVTHHGSAGILGARASRPQTAVCRLLGARASRPGSPHEGGTPAWECGRPTRRQQCDPSRERGHRALDRLTRVGRPPGCAGVAPAYSSRPITGARASCPRSPHDGGTPSWVCGRRARTPPCDPSRERGPRALGCLTRVARPPGCAGVAPAHSSVTHHGSEGIVPSAASRGWDALLGARASRPREQCDLSRDQGHCALGRLTRAGRPARRLA